MKRIYIVITALALSAGSFAQTADSLLRRQMELERNFNPTLMDADKINSLPALREPSVQKANTNYSNWAGRATPSLEIALPQPGTIMTDIPFSMKRGYLSFNAGNYANLDGAFGYRLLDTEKNNLAFSFLHNSSNGELEYLQGVEGESNKAYFMDNKGGLDFKHRADALTLDMELSYLHSKFNYYGNHFTETGSYDDEMQGLGVLQAKVGITSQPSDLLNYKGYINFRNFSTSFGELINNDGIKGNEINAMVGLDKPFGASSKIGIDGYIYSSTYQGDFNNFFLINAAPYLTFGSAETYAKLGVDVMFQNSNGTKARVAPNVSLRWGVSDHTSLYANIHGGFQNNTYLDMLRESRYIRPYGTVNPSYSIVDVEAGARIGEVSGFRFDIFGGFKKTDDEHFLLLNGIDMIDNLPLGLFKEVLRPIYGDLSHSHIGAMIHSNIWAPLDISLRLKKNFYNISYLTFNDAQINDPKAYNKPGFEVDLRATYTVTSALKVTANYYLASDRWTYFDNANIEMDNINDLNLGAVYQINEAFAINLRANNLFGQKYDLWYGHPAQGLNISGGFSFRF